MSGEIYDYTKFGAEPTPPPVPTRPSAPQEPRPKKKSGIPCLGCSAVAIGLFFAAAVVTAIVFGLPVLMKSNDAYADGLARAQQDFRVRSVLGDPITDGWMPTGSVNANGSTGSVSLRVGLSGPNATGTLEIEATKSGTTWTYQTLGVRLDEIGGNGYINLLEP